MSTANPLFLWFWGLGQATLFAFVALCLTSFCTRVSPALRVKIYLWSLVGMLVCPVLMVATSSLPIPSPVSWISSFFTDEPIGVQPSDPVPAAVKPTSQLAGMWAGTSLQITSWLSDALEGAKPNTADTQPQWSTGTIVAYAMFATILLGFLRLLVAQYQINRLVHQSVATDEPRLLQVVAQCRQSMQLSTPSNVECMRASQRQRLLVGERPGSYCPMTGPLGVQTNCDRQWHMKWHMSSVAMCKLC